jgi:hypothetical protein
MPREETLLCAEPTHYAVDTAHVACYEASVMYVWKKEKFIEDPQSFHTASPM